jgi:hypothetical protein
VRQNPWPSYSQSALPDETAGEALPPSAEAAPSAPFLAAVASACRVVMKRISVLSVKFFWLSQQIQLHCRYISQFVATGNVSSIAYFYKAGFLSAGFLKRRAFSENISKQDFKERKF